VDLKLFDRAECIGS